MRVAAVQLCAGPGPAENLARAQDGVRAAAAAGARLVVLPEKWRMVGDGEALAAIAEPVAPARSSGDEPGGGRPGGLDPHAVRPEKGTALAAMAGLAAELGIDLVAGSVPESEPGDPRPFNTSVHLRPDGTVAATYRKVHRFDADVAGRRYRESEGERAGGAAVVSPVGDEPRAMLGLSICFDLRFPELFVAQAAAGATVFVVPSAFTARTTQDHWEVLLRARAIEHGAYVIAPNQSGVHADGSRSGGRSTIVDPWGRVLAQAAADTPDVVVADLDLTAIDEARTALPVGDLRRPDVYARPALVGPGRAGTRLLE